jgi:hypothetical protein
MDHEKGYIYLNNSLYFFDNFITINITRYNQIEAFDVKIGFK